MFRDLIRAVLCGINEAKREWKRRSRLRTLRASDNFPF